jgi:hypothetical protein
MTHLWKRLLISSFIFIALNGHAMAAQELYSASLSNNGQIEKQSPHWIESVSHTNDEHYAATYDLKFVPGAFDQAPAFCIASSNDQSSYDAALYGIAKVVGHPTKRDVKVISRLVGNDRPSTDFAMSFYLVCHR